MSRLIDGDALIDNICRYASPEMAWDRIDIVHKINEMPTIEERKTGKWVGIQAYCDHMNEITVGSRFIPSGMACGVYCNQCWERNSEKKNFCPNCGAKMEGEQP